MRRPTLSDPVYLVLVVRTLGHFRAIESAHKERAVVAARGGCQSPPVALLVETQQVMHRFDEVALSGRHREVDGVEVDLAVEAANQVFLGVLIRAAFAAAGTDEVELPTPRLVRPVEAGQQRREWHLVA